MGIAIKQNREEFIGDDPIDESLRELEAIRQELLLPALEGGISPMAAQDLKERLDRIEWTLSNL